METSVERWREQERQRERERQRTSPGVLASEGHAEERRPCVYMSMYVCANGRRAGMGGMHSKE